MKRRVVVTGMGAVTPLGNDVETFWQQIKAGKSGITELDSPAFSSINTRIAGVVKDFSPEAYLSKKEIKKYDRCTQYGCAAAEQAITQAGMDLDEVDKNRVGVYVGSGAGGIETLLDNYDTMKEKGSNRVSPFLIPMSITNMTSGVIAMRYGFCGPSFSIGSACATSNHMIGEAYRNIAHGYTDVMLAGGAEATIHPLYFAGFSKMKAMSTKNDTPTTASRPFDMARDGFVMAEGAGVLCLESYEHAKERGATILGEIIGYGATTDAYHMTNPDYKGAVKAMGLALDEAGISPERIDYINAHGTSTGAGDISETKAIQEVFNPCGKVPKVSSTKSMTGHLFGAAGAVEAIITLKSIEQSVFPPTINLENIDQACQLNHVPNHAVDGNIDVALSNGFGFGGHNAVVVFKKI